MFQKDTTFCSWLNLDWSERIFILKNSKEDTKEFIQMIREL